MIKFSLQLKTWQYCNTSIFIAAISSYEQVSTLMSDYSAKSQIKNAARKSRTILRPAIQNECGNTNESFIKLLSIEWHVLLNWWTNLNLTRRLLKSLMPSSCSGLRISTVVSIEKRDLKCLLSLSTEYQTSSIEFYETRAFCLFRRKSRF